MKCISCERTESSKWRGQTCNTCYARKWRSTERGKAVSKSLVHRRSTNIKWKTYMRDYEKLDSRVNYKLKKHYGISLEDYNRMLSDQKGLCAICGCPETTSTKKRLAVDHDHKTGKIRSLLCRACNVSVGLLKESPVTALNLRNYLLKHNNET